MATYSWVDFHHKEAARLADLQGIKEDLECARDFALSWKAEMGSISPQLNWGEALSISISIKYARPFATGVRAKLSEDDLAGLDLRQRSAHDYLLAYRAKHVAHSVNGYENNQPRAHYCSERVREEGITSITCSHARVTGLSGQRLNDVVELCSHFVTLVEQRIEAECVRLLDIARATPLDQLLGSGQRGFSATHLGDVSKGRK